MDYLTHPDHCPETPPSAEGALRGRPHPALPVEGATLAPKDRFEVVYHLYSMPTKKRIRIKVRLNESDASVPSVMKIWEAADWFEREAFDMLGIKFVGHPNLKRLLMWNEFQGYPLRKDYPIDKRQPIPEPAEIV